MFSEKQRLFLGIDETEQSLLRALQKNGEMNTWAAAEAAKLPRLRSMRHLYALLRRGYVARHRRGREVRWSLINPLLIRKRFAQELEIFSAHSVGRFIGLSDVASVTTYRGPQELFSSNQKLLIAHEGERITALLPNDVWKYAVKIPPKEWEHLNKALTRRKITMDVLLEEGFEKAIRKYATSLWEKSFFALLTHVRIIPSGVISTPVELFLFRDEALLSDWQQSAGVQIKNQNVVNLLRSMFESLKKESHSFSS